MRISDWSSDVCSSDLVVAAVEHQLYAEEGFRASSKQPDSIDAWGLVVRALSLINKMERRQNEEARSLLSRALAMEPGYERAHALLRCAAWRSDELRVGKECVSQSVFSLSPFH